MRRRPSLEGDGGVTRGTNIRNVGIENRSAQDVIRAARRAKSPQGNRANEGQQ